MSTVYYVSKNGQKLRKMNMGVYPKNWDDIRERIKKRAGYVCEGTPQYPNCNAIQGKKHPDTDNIVYLQVAHMDHDTTNNVDSNLRALCPRCHLTYDIEHHKQQKLKNREKILIENGQLSF
jgi:protein-arginine kinase activator protein McsA